MESISIKSKHILKIIDCDDETDLYGSNQEWYSRKIQRLSGCGPATVTNILYYIKKKHIEESCCKELTRDKCISMMDEMWNYVTPGPRGIPSTEMLGDGIIKYLQEKKLDIRLDYLDIPEKKELRPDLSTVTEFLRNALQNDTPVAFLNLDNGTVAELYSYHWVTAISLKYSLNENVAYIHILDGGLEIEIDLFRWLNTTKAGGGFVSFSL